MSYWTLRLLFSAQSPVKDRIYYKLTIGSLRIKLNIIIAFHYIYLIIIFFVLKLKMETRYLFTFGGRHSSF